MTEELAVGEVKTITESFKTELAGNVKIRAELSVQAEGSVKQLEQEVSVIVPNGKKSADNAHKNIGVVNGTMLEFSEVLRLFGYQVSFNTNTITPSILKDVDVLILNTPHQGFRLGALNKLAVRRKKQLQIS